MMKLKKMMSLLAAAAMVLGLGACSKAPQSQQKSNGDSPVTTSADSGKKETLVLGTAADFAPYEYHKIVNGEDTILGFDVALAKQVAEDMGAELIIKDMEFSNLLMELQNGTVDMVAAGLSPTDERKKQVDFSDPYFYGSQCMVIRVEDKEKYTSLNAFEGQPVAAQVGSIQEGIVKNELPGANMVSLAKPSEEIMSLSSGKVEGVALSLAVAKGFVSKNTDLMIAEFEVPYEKAALGTCIAVKKGNTDLLEKINGTVKSVTESGKMDEFVEKASAQAEY